MNLEAIKTAVTSKAARQIFLTKKHSPQILFVAGAVGVVGTVVLACRATLKTGDILEKHETLARMAKSHGDDEEIVTKNSHKLQVNTALAITKAYLPAIGLGLVSIGALAGGQVILTKRNGTLMAAYIGLDRAYNEYRARVASEYGVDTDRKFSLGGEEVAATEKLANGTEQMKLKMLLPENHEGRSPYAALFDEKSKKFSREPGRNAMTLEMNQSWATDKLRAQGHLFLNEVLDMLDLPRSPQGQFVGWLYDPKDPEFKGDGYVSFGIWENDDDYVGSFLDGREHVIWLDFNVDGPIYDKI